MYILDAAVVRLPVMIFFTLKISSFKGSKKKNPYFFAFG